MNTRYKIITIISLLAVGLAACGPAAGGTTTPPTRSISVNGIGKVTLKPDMATVFIGVYTEKEDAEQALAENNRQTEAVMEALKAFEISEDDLQTSNFSIYPRYNYDPMGQITETVYVVQNTVQVTLRDLNKLGEVLNTVVDSGVNTISGINFDLSDRESANMQAMELAVQNARQRAEALAAAAGAKLGDVQQLNTNIYGGGIYMPFSEMAMDKGGGGMGMGAAVPVSPGQLEISVDVYISYEIK